MAKFLAQRLCTAALRSQGRLSLQESRIIGAVSSQTADLHTSPRLNSESAHKALHAPSNFDKRILVWHGSYESMDDVPREVSKEKLAKAKDWVRIRVSIYMLIACLSACAGIMYVGKRYRGQSIALANQEYNETVEKEISQANNQK